jgi:hypothetical protein
MNKKFVCPSLPTLRRINEALLRVSVVAAPLMAFITIMPNNGRWH